MSENEIEDNDNAIVESEVVDSEAIDTEELQPVVKKKGSFLSFLAFVFSLAALVLSGYMYYAQYYLAEPQDAEKPWQHPLTQLQSQLKNNADNIQNLTTIISAMKTVNQSLSDQLNSVKNTDSPENTDSQAYDDSQLTENIVNLQNQLTEQNKQLSAINQQQDQALVQFKQRYEKEKGTQTTNSKTPDPIQKQKQINIELIEAYLLAAHKNLNVRGNDKTAETALGAAIKKLNELSNDKFSGLIEELNTVSNQLKTSKKVDVFALNMDINALESSINKFTFVRAQGIQENEEKQSSSWYDNLVKIKKIDDQEQKLLTKNEQSSIRQSIKLHFDLLRSALVSQDLGLWVSEIEALSTLIEKHFAKTKDMMQDSILKQLDELKYKNINPSFPDLSIYLQKFNALLNTHTAGE